MRIAAVVVTMTALGLSDALIARRDPAARVGWPVGTENGIPGSHLPVIQERRYVMSGAARPLLFWIGRDDIGLARIVWRRRDDGARGYELLVGTDPGQAPRGINRWGFIAEETLGAGGSVLAIMTGSHETSYEEEATATRGSAKGEFRTIRSRVQDGAVAWQLEHMRTPEALTVHQVAEALEYSKHDASDGLPRRRSVPAAARSGFLVAVADLVDATVAASRGSTGASQAKVASVQYVFGEDTYELRVRAVDPEVVTYAGRNIPALKTSFETRTLLTGERTRFELTIGTTAETTGVPLLIEWQPRWWLKVKLRLES
ncbi:MAG: hypothetical protein ACRD15_07335 [Vicinamibacterales bacterium]